MIHTILDACQYVLETQDGPQSPCWLSSLMDEMKLWKANEHEIRAALDKDIAKRGNASRFVTVADDEYGLRNSPTSKSTHHDVPPDLIDHTANRVRNVLSGDGTGHDWWHVYRVWKMARRIGRAEQVDLVVVELAALLHDVADWKLHEGDSQIGPRVARDWLDSLNVDPRVSDQVCRIIADISFKGAGVEQPQLSLEGQVVQDADRLDAIGAIGIARAFAYGGAKGRLLYDPTVAPVEHRTAEAYLRSDGTTINHFHEKLLLLKDRVNTATGKAIAEQRHKFMECYLRRFMEEWEGA